MPGLHVFWIIHAFHDYEFVYKILPSKVIVFIHKLWQQFKNGAIKLLFFRALLYRVSEKSTWPLSGLGNRGSMGVTHADLGPLGGVHKLRLQDLSFFWPPTPPPFTFSVYFLLFPYPKKFSHFFFLTVEKIGIDEKVICYRNISN